VDQFQVFPGGNGRLGAHEVTPVLVHYADAYMTYGPIVAGSQGVQYLTVRITGDPGPQYMPESRLTRKRVNGRYIVRTIAADDRMPLLEVEAQHPDARIAGGLHIFVLDGSLQRAGQVLPRLSNVFIEADEGVSLGQAGPEGLRLLLLYFPDQRPATDTDGD
jgi:hypothetical protein